MDLIHDFKRNWYLQDLTLGNDVIFIQEHCMISRELIYYIVLAESLLYMPMKSSIYGWKMCMLLD
jgi:hypothetical protein